MPQILAIILLVLILSPVPGWSQQITQLAVQGKADRDWQVSITFSQRAHKAKLQTDDNAIKLTWPKAKLAAQWRYSMHPWAAQPVLIKGQQQHDGAIIKIANINPAYLQTHQSVTGHQLTVSLHRSAAKLASLDVYQADLAHTILYLAKLSGKNIVLASSIEGKISAHIHQVPWQQMLTIILRTHGLMLHSLPHVLVIGKAQDLLSQLQKTNKAKQQMQNWAPLQTQVFTLHYARVQPIAKQLKHGHNSLLSKRGSVSADKRTNTLTIKDTRQDTKTIAAWLGKLDVPTKQVHIKAQIVLLNASAKKSLGLLLRQHRQHSDLGGMNMVDDQSEATGTFSFSLGRIGHNSWLGWELKALEASNEGESIADPELTVSNHQQASIEQGSDVPFQVATASGATSVQFKKAVMGLKVTPNIGAGKRIALDLTVSKNDVTQGRGTAKDTPIVATSVIKTHVQVLSGHTIVLGGIKSFQHQRGQQAIPGLSSVPLLGHIGQSQSQSRSSRELLLFITPTIVAQHNRTFGLAS